VKQWIVMIPLGGTCHVVHRNCLARLTTPASTTPVSVSDRYQIQVCYPSRVVDAAAICYLAEMSK